MTRANVHVVFNDGNKLVPLVGGSWYCHSHPSLAELLPYLLMASLNCAFGLLRVCAGSEHRFTEDFCAQLCFPKRPSEFESHHTIRHNQQPNPPWFLFGTLFLTQKAPARYTFATKYGSLLPCSKRPVCYLPVLVLLSSLSQLVASCLCWKAMAEWWKFWVLELNIIMIYQSKTDTKIQFAISSCLEDNVWSIFCRICAGLQTASSASDRLSSSRECPASAWRSRASSTTFPFWGPEFTWGRQWIWPFDKWKWVTSILKLVRF